MTAPRLLLREALALIHRAPTDLWPGFAPATVPTVVFDGEATWLNGATPQEPHWNTTAHGWRWPGRHPALVANTAVTLPGGTLAAGLLLDGEEARSLEPERLASILVHEGFHVYQAAHPSPAWEANELHALTYPAGHAGVLHARLEEQTHLSAALASEDWTPHAQRALVWHTARHTLLSAEHQQYEQRIETLEGLAQFVESRFLNELPPLHAQPAATLSARQWAYLSGAAYAFLLSRGAAGWQAEVIDGAPLAEVLRNRVGSAAEQPPASPALLERAERAAQGVQQRLEQLEEEFNALPGKQLLITGPRLQMVGFDPMNLHALGGGRILHTRYFKVVAGDAEIEVLGGQGMTTGMDTLRPTSVLLTACPEPTLQAGRWIIQSEKIRLNLPASKIKATPTGWLASLD